jgi:hypothetical protein
MAHLRVDVVAAEANVAQRALVEPFEVGAQAMLGVDRREAVEQPARRQAARREPGQGEHGCFPPVR